MPRGLSSAVKSTLESSRVLIAHLVEIELSSFTLRLWDGVGPMDYAGNTYQGNGWFLDFTPLQESEDVRADGFDIQLTGVSEEVLALILNENQQNRAGRVYMAILADNGAVIPDPIEMCSGELDFPEIVEGPQQASIVTLNYESDLLQFREPNEQRYTDQNQRLRYPLDTGLRHVANLQNKRAYWGSAGAIPFSRRA